MITVRIHQREKHVKSVRVTGHSGYADAGEDIVCSGISVLTISVINGLTEVVGLNDSDVIEAVEPGRTIFHVPEGSTPEQALQIQTLLDTYVLNVKATSDEYQDFVKVIIKED